MRSPLAACLLALPLALPLAAAAQDGDPRDAAIAAAVQNHALPGFEALAAAGAGLAEAARAETGETCGGPAFKDAWAAAFDAWIAVSHLRFGPTEAEDRAFALAFWPDTKGFTPKALRNLSDDPGALSDLHHSSIAGRGFYAMEQLLYDADFADLPHRCAILDAQAEEVARLTAEILEGWKTSRAQALLDHDADPYRDASEAVREMYKALDAGLQWTADARLGRPLGTFDRPRPMRAEARRSARSLRHVRIALASLEELAVALATAPGDQAALRDAFAGAREAAAQIDDPDLAGVADPAGRFRIEALQTEVEALRERAAAILGAALGVDAGFNALDGD